MIGELSAPGSHIAIEHIQNIHSLFDEPMLAYASEQFGMDVRSLLHEDDRPAPDARLASRGWAVTVDSAHDIADQYGRESDSTVMRFNEYIRFITGWLPR